MAFPDKHRINLTAATSFLVLACIAAAQTPSPGTLTTLHYFSSTDAYDPLAGLTLGDNGNWYGTTAAGGPAGGTIFQITPSGVLTTLHVFAGGNDGASPRTALVKYTDGSFYGTTNGAQYATTFRITPDGAFTSFGAIPMTAGLPNGLVLGSDGNLYGTTMIGGQGGNGGIFYRLTPDGVMTGLHTFGNPGFIDEGSAPNGLVQGLDGNFYGTTRDLVPGGPGTSIFKITPDGDTTVLLGLPASATNLDGSPASLSATVNPLILGSDGNFYGVNSFQLFRVTPAGVATILASGTYGLMQFRGYLENIMQGSDGNFYCSESDLDTIGSTSIIQVTPQGGITTIYTFQAFTVPNAEGVVNAPEGLASNTLAQGPDALYGTTQYGGPTTATYHPTLGNSGTVFKLAVGSGGGSAPPAFTLLDAVPTFVNASSVNSNSSGLVFDPTLLNAAGRTVVGVAADGVSRALLRGVTTSTLTFTLLDENMNPIGQSTEYGGLAQATGAGSGFSNSVVIPSVSSMAFVVYKSPTDFVRSDPAYQASDQLAVSRTVNIQIATGDGTVVTTYAVTLVRPPVVLIHGFTSEPQFWSTFTPLVTDCAAPTVSGDPRFYVLCADYSKIVPGVVSIEPNYLGVASVFLVIQPVKQNVLGYAYNAQVVFGQMQNALAMFSQSSPQAGNKPVAAVQVDAVGHSMGNLIARTMPYVLTAAPNNYKQSANYGQGIMHKLISIAGPHLGSALSIVSLDPLNVCAWYGAAAIGEYPLQSAMIAGSSSPISGGAADLVGDGQGNCVSPALGTLQGQADKQIPVALIAGEMSAAQLAGLDSSLTAVAIQLLLKISAFKLACGTDYSLQEYSSADWLTLNRTSAPNQSDAIVPMTSALNGMGSGGGCVVHANQTPAQPPCHVSLVQYAVHGPGTVSEVGFPGPSLLDASAETPVLTINLLNAKVSDPAFGVLSSVPVNQVGGCK